MDYCSDNPRHLIVDAIHGDIHLTDRERSVLDTASFQRLRQLKQLQMGQITYPNATHTRFAHSVGVLGITGKVLYVAKKSLGLDDDVCADLRLAALLHDIGHYPYSHLMEGVDKVILTEDLVRPTSSKSSLSPEPQPYPDHETVGRRIVTSQDDLVQAIGGVERAGRIADLFSRTQAADKNVSKLLHSSLDMDRLDFLARDSYFAGVPYGRIDSNYLLNNLKIGDDKTIGIGFKALPAAEHFLMARFFMYRAVYYHKTTVAMEEACRQLLRRLRDTKMAQMPANGADIEQLVSTPELLNFTDAFVDRIVHEAAQNEDEVIAALARSIQHRRPPKLLREVPAITGPSEQHHQVSAFWRECKHQLADLARNHDLHLGRFLLTQIKPLRFEAEMSQVAHDQVGTYRSEEEDIKVFLSGDKRATSIVDVPHSIIHHCSNKIFRCARLYVVLPDGYDPKVLEELRGAAAEWS